jgi:hypothetical protein
VIVWGTGSIGRVVLRHVIDRPDLELVGVRVYGEQKVGRDAGELVRREPTGVIATDDVDALLALDADVVLHTPLNGEDPSEHVPDVVALLGVGKNVVTTVGFTYPWGSPGVDTDAILAAAREGGATLYGTGINPGFIVERLAVSLTTVCTDVRSIQVREVYDCAPVSSEGFVYDLCGFGKTPADFRAASAGRERFFESLFGEVIRFVFTTLGVKLVKVEPAHEQVTTDVDLHLRAGTIPAGTVSGIRWRWIAHGPTGPFFTFQMDWRVDEDAPGFGGEDGWTITVDGAPQLAVTVRLDDPTDVPEKSKAMQYAVAGPVVSAIGEVVAAAPGIMLPASFARWTPTPELAGVSH